MLQLATTVPAAVLADLLGIHTTTAADWAHAAGGDSYHYAGELSGPPPTPCRTPPKRSDEPISHQLFDIND